jgi:molybdopterin synthase catalytic subunit
VSEVSPVVAKVVSEPIDGAFVSAALSGVEHGAQLLFHGTVRNRNEGRPVVAVSYDVFAPLAEATFREIGEEACARFGPALRVVVVHRSGRLELGEVSVVVGVASPHRDEAYLASRYVIEQLKVRSPVWKQEHYADGDSAWLRGHALRSAGAEPSGPDSGHADSRIER